MQNQGKGQATVRNKEMIIVCKGAYVGGGEECLV